METLGRGEPEGRKGAKALGDNRGPLGREGLRGRKDTRALEDNRGDLDRKDLRGQKDQKVTKATVAILVLKGIQATPVIPVIPGLLILICWATPSTQTNTRGPGALLETKAIVAHRKEDVTMAKYRILSEGDPAGLTPESFSRFGELRPLPTAVRRLWILEVPDGASYPKEDLMPFEATSDGCWRTRVGLIWRLHEEAG